jgi:uncharacterized membrane protein
MQFLRDIRPYVKEFESKNRGEIYRFLDFLEDKYSGFQPKPAVAGTPVAPVVATNVEVPKIEKIDWLGKKLQVLLPVVLRLYVHVVRDLRSHLNTFETQNKDEIYRFLDFMEEKYRGFQPQPAVPGAVKPTVAEPATNKRKGGIFGWLFNRKPKLKKE